MEIKDYIYLGLIALGYIVNIIQYLFNRKDKRKDKLYELKFDTYYNYLKQVDKIMENMRKAPFSMLDYYNKTFKEILTSTPEEMNSKLINFNNYLMEFIKNASEPQMIIRQETNALYLICSEDLKIKVNEQIELVTDYNNEVQKCLSFISPNDSNSFIREMQTLSQNDRWKCLESLRLEIIEIMRKEIGNNKKKKKIGAPMTLSRLS